VGWGPSLGSSPLGRVTTVKHRGGGVAAGDTMGSDEVVEPIVGRPIITRTSRSVHWSSLTASRPFGLATRRIARVPAVQILGNRSMAAPARPKARRYSGIGERRGKKLATTKPIGTRVTPTATVPRRENS